MNVQARIDLLVQTQQYILHNGTEWQATKEKAYLQNAWFIPEFVNVATQNIAQFFLEKNLLENWVKQYAIPHQNNNLKNIGIVMAGNIPMVGFHDFLCAFICGHKQTIKPSTKDDVLLKHIVALWHEWQPETKELVAFADNLKGCDAYIATGSNNSSRYFDYYFGKYPHIIRKNRTSIAVLTGNETAEELQLLAKDIQLYFGLGCRNVTQLWVPKAYDFIPLLEALKEYEYYLDFHKYKHNYDYHLALLIMGNKQYMNNNSIVLVENESVYSPISQLHYQYYTTDNDVSEFVIKNKDAIQCVVGKNYIPFGQAQQPNLTDYADGVDTMEFLLGVL